jgi:NADH-quinone oxidoreductase subunit M
MALGQLDMKKIIAYSSVSHMGLVTAALFSTTPVGVTGSVYMMLSHGLISSALFIFIGALYERYGSRNILYYTGLTTTMPILMVFGFFFILANIGFPGTCGFVAEFLCLFGVVAMDATSAVLLCFSIIITAAYSLWLFNRVAFGPVNTALVKFKDVDKNEFYVLFVLTVLIVLFGVYPMCILRVLEGPVTMYLLNMREHLLLVNYFTKAHLLTHNSLDTLLGSLKSHRPVWAGDPFP